MKSKKEILDELINLEQSYYREYIKCLHAPDDGEAIFGPVELLEKAMEAQVQ